MGDHFEDIGGVQTFKFEMKKLIKDHYENTGGKKRDIIYLGFVRNMNEFVRQGGNNSV